jgi:hypothetical protein
VSAGAIASRQLSIFSAAMKASCGMSIQRFGNHQGGALRHPTWCILAHVEFGPLTGIKEWLTYKVLKVPEGNMSFISTKAGTALIGGAIVASLAVAAPARASVIDWTDWSTSTTGASAGAASGTAGAVGVSYSGELESLVLNYPSWTPSSSYVGGSIGNAPPPADNIIQLVGGNAAVTDTITFSQAVTDPVMAIWSLGAGSTIATFDFNEPFTIEAGGPSAEYGGSSITSILTVVSGAEGNGTIQFNGTFTQISWTNPNYENWYGFTVGVPAVPEPSTWAMMLLGFAGLGFAGYWRTKKSDATFAAA